MKPQRALRRLVLSFKPGNVTIMLFGLQTRRRCDQQKRGRVNGQFLALDVPELVCRKLFSRFEAAICHFRPLWVLLEAVLFGGYVREFKRLRRWLFGGHLVVLCWIWGMNINS